QRAALAPPGLAGAAGRGRGRRHLAAHGFGGRGGGGGGGVSLGDTTTVAAVNGVATFQHLRIDKAGTGYRLVASAPGTALPPARSQPFAILAPLTGNITVTTTTSGADVPGSYSVTLDDTISQPMG